MSNPTTEELQQQEPASRGPNADLLIEADQAMVQLRRHSVNPQLDEESRDSMTEIKRVMRSLKQAVIKLEMDAGLR